MMGWLFVIVTYLNYGEGLYSYGVVPSPMYASKAECENARANIYISPEKNGIVSVYPCAYRRSYP